MTDKQKAIEELFKKVNKDYGAGSLVTANEKSVCERLPTGILSLDRILGGGLPKGGFVHMYAPFSAGKTTVALEVVANTQKNGGNCAYIDVEHALNFDYMQSLGIDLDNLLLSQPATAEIALDIQDAICRSGAMDLIVLDSVASMVPRKVLEGNADDDTMGLLARRLSKMLPKLVAPMAKYGTVIILINQMRQGNFSGYGSPDVTPGGKAIDFYAWVDLHVKRIGVLGDKDEPTGIRSSIKTTKNKTYPPFKTCEFNINFGTGIDKETDLLETAIELGVLERGGAGWTTLPTGDKVQGLEKVKEYYSLYLDEKTKLIESVYEKMK